MLKKWFAVVLVLMLAFAPVTAEARGFGAFSGRSSYSSSSSGSRGFSFHSGSSSHGFSSSASSSRTSGLFGSGRTYRNYARPSFGSHLASFGLGMLIGGMFHPFGGYYGYGTMYGYHPFGFIHFILDIIVLLIVFRILRAFFRR